MKATLTYEGKTVEVEISGTEVQKIFNEPNKTGWERVEAVEHYNYIYIGTDTEDETQVDDNRYQEGRYISSNDLAKDQARAISLWMRIKRWAAEHCEPVNWRDPDSGKYLISYNNTKNEICYDGVYVFRGAFQIYFDTKEHAQQCIEEFKDELTWYFTKCKDRMDG